MSNIGRIDVKGELNDHGYLMIRELLPPEHIQLLLEKVTDVLYRAAWLDETCSPFDRIASVKAACAEGDKAYKATSEAVFNLQAFHEMPHHSILKAVMQMVVGPHLLIHPKSQPRLIFPNFERGIIRAHQDHTAVGGDAETYTAWMPLHDCPLEQGPLKIMAGSHRFGLQAADKATGFIKQGTERGTDWIGGDIRAGDLLLFHSLTVHEAAPNRSKQLRISLDCRFQSYERTVNPSALVFTGPSDRSWEDVYDNWTSDLLKYYWLKLPLKLEPSKRELARLAQVSELEPMRARHARILQRIEAQMPKAL